ncbi:mandelate racemase/muconate lactonizing enzyme family protein [Cognataquiflexum rubidum]|uniref:mandelate racemase/muconate lactonizing enzyme family protein n=1 Tax=Cognataquiflexum rubidum TaxID=2922273 RepID=UPI001F141F57|nr:mandelate racemase/muconate lactonizing enzyme family protein [Cognataquiflexum rubidum]MCH6233160.1 mandelate racemase/muconate lactonizing enzyme family protein [Cognataquiflexum rubidum]
MNRGRRNFISKAMCGTLIAGAAPIYSGHELMAGENLVDLNHKYQILDEILAKPVFRRELFPDPVIIESIGLLKYGQSFLCLVREKNGATGISVGHSDLKNLYPIFLNKVQPFFIGKDARLLDDIIERVYIYNLNFRHNGISIGIPIATIEFAILDMMGKISGKSLGNLIGDIHNPEVGVYIATEFREKPLDEHLALIQETVSQYDVDALKIKVGYQHAWTKELYYKGPEGKTEKLIPKVREIYGSQMALYADANGYYNVPDAIRVGKILEEYKYEYFEEPVMFDHFEDIKSVADGLKIPIANGEQDYSFYNFRWLIANDGIEIVQPDNFYFGGFIRSMKVAQMAHAFGKSCVPHMSGVGLGYLYDIHFVSAIPNAGEHHETHGLKSIVPFECTTSPLKIENGKIKVPTGPGLGITIDPDFIAKHQEVKL